MLLRMIVFSNKKFQSSSLAKKKVTYKKKKKRKKQRNISHSQETFVFLTQSIKVSFGKQVMFEIIGISYVGVMLELAYLSIIFY